MRVAYDRQVLRFWGYSNESVHFSNEESSRVRVFTIYYYLQDDTVHINEKKQETIAYALDPPTPPRRRQRKIATKTKKMLNF